MYKTSAKKQISPLLTAVMLLSLTSELAIAATASEALGDVIGATVEENKLLLTVENGRCHGKHRVY